MIFKFNPNEKKSERLKRFKKQKDFFQILTEKKFNKNKEKILNEIIEHWKNIQK